MAPKKLFPQAAVNLSVRVPDDERDKWRRFIEKYRGKFNLIGEKEMGSKNFIENDKNKPILDFLLQKIHKYEYKIYEWCYHEGDAKVWDNYQKLWNNMKIWKKGLYYVWLYNEIEGKNYDFTTREYLPFDVFTLHHERYIWTNLLTKAVYPINIKNHKQGKMMETDK